MGSLSASTFNHGCRRELSSLTEVLAADARLSQTINSTMAFDRDMLEAAFKKHAAAEDKADTLTQKEFVFMFTELVGHGKYEVEDIMEMFAGVKGGDEEVTFDEFWNALNAKPPTKKQLKATFAEFDKDGSGMLSKVSIEEFLALW